MAGIYKEIGGGGLSAPIDATDISSGNVDNTEFDYLDNLTSSIQTQLNAKLSTTLADGRILVGDVSNAASAVVPTGDVTISNTGVTAISAGAIVNNDVNASAAIDLSKLASLNNSIVPVTNGSGVITSSAVTATQLSYVDATSSIQTQLDGKQTTTLADGKILIGNSSNVATAVTPSGDVTMSNAGVNAIAAGVIVDNDINASAAIAFSKLAALTAGNVLLGNGSNVPTSTALSGDVTVNSSGVTAIASDVIVNADVKTDAAIAFSKLAALTSGNILVGSAGNVATSVAMSGDATIVASGALTIANSAVSNAKMANMNNNTFKGNNTGSAAAPVDLTAAQATAILSAMVGDSGSGGTKGLVPAPASGDAAASKFLKADATWAAVTASLTYGAVRLHTYAGYGSTNTKIMRFTTNVGTTGSLITYTASSTNGDSFTIGANALVYVAFNSDFGASNSIGISLNSSELTTNIGSITAADRLALSQTSAAGVPTCVTFVGYIASGGVIRAHTTGNAANTAANSNFNIVAIQV